MHLFNELEKYGSNIAVLTENKSFTYRQLLDDMESLYRSIGKRCLILFVAKNTYSSICAYISFLKNRIVPLMVPCTLSEDQRYELVSLYQPQYIWQPKNKNTRKSLFTLYDYELVETEYKHTDLHEDLALLLTTSGSTGSPKYVRQSYNNIKSNTNSIINYLGVVSSDRAITTLPMSYTYGLSIINTHISRGASIIVTEHTLMQKDFWRLFSKYMPNNFGGVPYTYEMLKRLHFERMDLSHLKYITQAGGKLGEVLHKYYVDVCKNNNIKFIVMYGQTEATARMAWLPWEKSEEKIGSIGIAIPGGELVIYDDYGNTVKESGKNGEMVYIGTNVTMGYASSAEDLALGDERNGRLETGDIAYFDDDGFFYISGRRKRFLKVYGNRVNLDELESILRADNYDAVVGGEDDHVVIYIVSNNEDNNVVEYLSKKIHINKSAFVIKEIDEIPRNEFGKVQYSKLALK